MEEMELLDAFEIDSKWMANNFKIMQKKFANKFVAVLNRKVIDFDEDADELMERLRDKLSEDELDITLVEFIPPKNLILIL